MKGFGVERLLWKLFCARVKVVPFMDPGTSCSNQAKVVGHAPQLQPAAFSVLRLSKAHSGHPD